MTSHKPNVDNLRQGPNYDGYHSERNKNTPGRHMDRKNSACISRAASFSKKDPKSNKCSKDIQYDEGKDFSTQEYFLTGSTLPQPPVSPKKRSRII